MPLHERHSWRPKPIGMPKVYAGAACVIAGYFESTLRQIAAMPCAGDRAPECPSCCARASLIACGLDETTAEKTL